MKYYSILSFISLAFVGLSAHAGSSDSARVITVTNPVYKGQLINVSSDRDAVCHLYHHEKYHRTPGVAAYVSQLFFNPDGNAHAPAGKKVVTIDDKGPTESTVGTGNEFIGTLYITSINCEDVDQESVTVVQQRQNKESQMSLEGGSHASGARQNGRSAQ